MIDPAGQPYDDQGSSSRGLVMIQNNDQMDRAEEQRRDVDPAMQDQRPVLNALASHIDSAWHANRACKTNIETILLKCLRMRNGEYEPDILTQLQAQGEVDLPVYMMVTDIKCRAAISWIKDAQLPTGEVPFRIDPTPIPELPESMREFAKQKIVTGLQQKLQQEGIAAEQLDRGAVIEIGEQVKKELQDLISEQAKKDAEKMTTMINDGLVEGGWYEAMDEFIDDFVTFPTAFLEGPVARKKRVQEWVTINEQAMPRVALKTVKEYRRISPFDVYPSSGARSLDDGNLIIHKRFSAVDIQAMIGIDGYDEAAIRTVMDLYAVGGLREWLSVDASRDPLEDHWNRSTDPEPTIDALKFMGNVRGSMLIEWGLSADQIPDPDIMYPISALKIGSYVIHAKINDHPLAKRPYHCASFIRKNGSIWGRGVPQVMEHIQRICNGCARGIVRNAAMASGPMVWINESRINAAQNTDEIFPWKIWRFNDGEVRGRSDLPMGFFMPQSVMGDLLAISKYYYDMASEITGIPAYMYGSEKVGGAGQTASGLSMLMNSAGKGLRASVIYIDKGIVKPSVEEYWLSIMLYEPEKAIGDVRIVARASDYLIQMDIIQNMLAEALQFTNNPTDLQIMGLEGRAEMLREYLKRLKFPGAQVIPDRETIVAQSASNQFAQLVQGLAQATGIPPDKLIAMSQQQQQQGQQQTRLQ